MKYEIACLLLVGSTLVPHWHLTFLHGDFCFALTWAVIRCRKQRKLSENHFAECREYKPTLAYKCECRQKSLTLPNVGNICIHWILWDIAQNFQRCNPLFRGYSGTSLGPGACNEVFFLYKKYQICPTSLSNNDPKRDIPKAKVQGLFLT